jgi:hypothetical protein
MNFPHIPDLLDHELDESGRALMLRELGARRDSAGVSRNR